MAERELTPNEALCYLDDIAHGRKMEFDPHVLKRIVQNGLESGERAHDILRIIFNAPSIIEQLFSLNQLGESAKQRYFWGTITDEDVKKVKEFFRDGEMRSPSK